MTGLTICFTEMRLISAELRKENEMEVTELGTECAMFITSPVQDGDAGPQKNRAKMGFASGHVQYSHPAFLGLSLTG